MREDHPHEGNVLVPSVGAARYYALVRDFLKTGERVWSEAWGNARWMPTRPVTLKAMVRVCADLAREDGGLAGDRVRRWQARLGRWAERVRDFRAEGFYERFPAKGQVERVGRLHHQLALVVGVG